MTMSNQLPHSEQILETEKPRRVKDFGGYAIIYQRTIGRKTQIDNLE